MKPVMDHARGSLQFEGGLGSPLGKSLHPSPKRLVPSRHLSSDTNQNQTPTQACSVLNLTPVSQPCVIMVDVSVVRDRPLTEYVLMRIHKWETAPDEVGRRRTARALEELAGIAKGFITKIKGGVGVSAKSGEGFAKAFGMAGGYHELHSAAYEWWKAQGNKLSQQVDELVSTGDPERDAAIQMAKVGNVSRESIIATLAKFRDVEGRNRWWWIAEFGRDVDALRATARKREAERVAGEALERQRRKAPDSGRVLQGAAPTPPTVQAEIRPKTRRKRVR